MVGQASPVPHALDADLGVFRSLAELDAAIQGYLDNHNADPKPFRWTARTANILEKVARGRQTFESEH